MDRLWYRMFEAGEAIGFLRLLGFLALYIVVFGLIFGFLNPS